MGRNLSTKQSPLSISANFDMSALAKKAESFPKSASMAINRVMKDSQKFVIREVRKRYNVDKELFAIKLDFIPATQGRLRSRFTGVGRGLTLYRFYESRDKEGVTVQITKGMPEKLRTAFPVKFKRSGKIFIVKNENGKLHVYRTISIPEMMGSLKSFEDWQRYVSDKLPAELDRLIKVYHK